MAGFKAMFGSAFLFANFAIFLWPLVVLWQLAFDTSMTFWFGHYLMAIFVIPVLFLSIYGWQVRAGKPINAGMTVAICFPALLLAGMGIALYMQANSLVDDIQSKGCDNVDTATGELQHSYATAKNFYACCQVKYGNAAFDEICHDEGINLPAVIPENVPLIEIQHCPGYYDMTVRNAHAKKWSYLQYLESNYMCAGFCSRDISLWTTQEFASPTCGYALEIIMQAKIANAGFMVIIYSIIVAVLYGVWFSFNGKALKELQGKGGLLSNEGAGLARYGYDGPRT